MHTLTSDRVHLRQLTAPYVSRRDDFPALHVVVQGVSPWAIGDLPEFSGQASMVTWSVVSFGRSTTSHDGGPIATETELTVEITMTRRDGTVGDALTRSCVLRTELDADSLADRQRTQQGWLLPIGYTVVVDVTA